MKAKHLVSMLLAGSMILGLTACAPTTNSGGGNDSPQPTGTDSGSGGASSEYLVYNVGEEPKTWDPQLNTSSMGGHVILNLYDGLVRDTRDGVQMASAERYELSANADGVEDTVYTFYLRDGLTWSDGEPVTASDSKGTVVDEAGFTKEKLARLIDIKERAHGRVADYAREFGLTYLEGQQPWSVPVDIALPCATQNELDVDAARQLIANGVKAVAEGANMPTTIAATDLFLEAGVLFAPGKAANAGGVATSGLEMAQNAARMGWKAEKVDARLHHIMLDIHHACVQYGGEAKQTNYVRGANIAGFVKVADAMLAQGVI